jgi:hypothetical protein
MPPSAAASSRWRATPGALEYLVEAGTSPGASNFFSSSVGASLSVGAIVPPGRYYVRVRARNSAGVSTSSEELVVIVP